MSSIPYRTARRIRRGERDHELELDAPRWPKTIDSPDGWDARRGGHLARVIAPEDVLARPLREAMLRFPAAPIHGVHRLHEGHSSVGQAENFHTYRILTSERFRRPASRVFLLHNGLNEVATTGLYYELASQLIAENEAGTACILRPFPGHLTRFPYHGFAEQPLDRYLWDGSHLFRQFLRYMVETQWFLSAFVNRSRYRCPSGANLLAESEDTAASRLNPSTLAREMGDAWREMYKASDVEIKKAYEVEDRAPEMKPIIKSSRGFREAITSLRSYLGLGRNPQLGSEFEPDQIEPSLHVIGYSLGGFTAQSIFMSWPYIVDSCSTLLSGGPLRELAPTAFADPEEWQTVLHSLRYELDDAMITGRYGDEDLRLAGMDRDLFLYFQRAFYEVFQQEYHGSFQSRLSAFRSRMFFVVGGNDPIVRPQSVLDSAPDGGINLLEIGGLGHFIASRSKVPEERTQRDFWLPEIGKLITRLADAAHAANWAARSDTWLDQKLLVRPTKDTGGNQDGSRKTSPAAKKGEGERLRLSEPERADYMRDGALRAQLFERHLDDLFGRIVDSPNSHLWILRNEIPTILLNPYAVQRRARALHHDDRGIAEYCRGVTRRRENLEERIEQVSIVLPWNADRILKRMDAPHGFPSQAETAVGQMPDEMTPATVWAECKASCDALALKHPEGMRVFTGHDLLDADHTMPEVAELVKAHLEAISKKDASVAGDSTLRVPSLPDCWIWVSNKFLRAEEETMSHERAREELSKVVAESQASDSWLKQSIRKDWVRVVTVSRARYNPRFRGRLVTDLESVKSVLLHAALCIASAEPFLAHTWAEEEKLARQRLINTTELSGGDHRMGPDRRVHTERVSLERRSGEDRRLADIGV
jgi:hypothetical protein